MDFEPAVRSVELVEQRRAFGVDLVLPVADVMATLVADATAFV